MRFQEIEAIPLTGRVEAALKEAFFLGRLKPGDAIVERQLAREMKVGTPVVREALISLQSQGFVRRVTNTGTFVTKFNAQEVRQLYALQIELEAVALEWARTRVTPDEVAHLTTLVDRLVEAGESGACREFLERDFAFHRQCWKLSGNLYLMETLERLVAPLFAFAGLASGVPITAAMGRERYALVNALAKLERPEFDSVVRRTLTGFALRWISAMSFPNGDGSSGSGAEELGGAVSPTFPTAGIRSGAEPDRVPKRRDRARRR
jgi:DNA-binding GntR family transcriptional regulator